jgi:hypothetical protein
LKEWEDTLNIKSGSIKQICIDFIKEKNDPVHLFELSQFVKIHRTTTSSNIYTNLQIDPHDNFEFYPGSFIGLKIKKYDDNIIASLQPISPVYSRQIGEFMRNHVFYPYNSLVEKFSASSNLLPIQIKAIISTKLEHGVLNLNNGRLNYASIEAENVLNQIFGSLDYFTRSGFNPYRCVLQDEKTTIQAKVLSSRIVSLEKDSLRLEKYDLDYCENRLILFYHKASKMCKAVFFKGSNFSEMTQLINGKALLQNSTYRKNLLNDSVIEIDFNIEESSLFIRDIINVLRNGIVSINKSIDTKLDGLELTGCSKLQAYSMIIEHFKNKLDIEIDLLEAKTHFENWKFSN